MKTPTITRAAFLRSNPGAELSLWGNPEYTTGNVRVSVICSRPSRNYVLQDFRVLGLRGATANEVVAVAKKLNSSFGVAALFEIIGKGISGSIRNGEMCDWRGNSIRLAA